MTFDAAIRVTEFVGKKNPTFVRHSAGTPCESHGMGFASLLTRMRPFMLFLCHLQIGSLHKGLPSELHKPLSQCSHANVLADWDSAGLPSARNL